MVKDQNEVLLVDLRRARVGFFMKSMGVMLRSWGMLRLHRALLHWHVNQANPHHHLLTITVYLPSPFTVAVPITVSAPVNITACGVTPWQCTRPRIYHVYRYPATTPPTIIIINQATELLQKEEHAKAASMDEAFNPSPDLQALYVIPIYGHMTMCHAHQAVVPQP